MINEEVLAELKATHGEIYLVETDGGESLVFRRPTRPEYKRFKSQVLDEQRRADADEQLVRTVAVYPEPTAVAALLEKLPAFATSASGAILKASGASQALEAKKL